MNEVNIAIIGCGTVAEKIHLPSLMKLKNVNIQTLVDVNIERAKALSEKFKLTDASLLSDYKEALKDPDIEAVWVLTPPKFHAEITLRAISEEKHVLVEKPLASSLTDALKIRRKLQTVNVRRDEDKLVVMPAHNFVFTPCYERAQQLLRDGVIGRVLEVKGRAVSNLSFYGAKTDFRLEAKGGVIEDQMPHIVYLAMRIAGGFSKVLDVSPYVDGKPVVEDARIRVAMNGDVKADLSAAWSGFFPKLSMTVIGEEGRLSMDLLRKPYSLTVRRGSEERKVKIKVGTLQFIDTLRGKHPSYTRENIHFIDVIQGEVSPAVEIDEGVEVVRVIDESINLLERLPKRVVKKDKVSLVKVKGEDLEKAIRKSIFLVGGLNVKRDSHVIVKPNICFWKNTENMVITDPKVLEAVLKILKEKTDRVTVVESDNNSGSAEKRVKATGVMEVIERCEADFINLSKDEYVEREVAGLTVRIPNTVLEADYVVNLPKMKTCNVENMLITIAMKNMFGIIPDRKKSRLHKKLVDVILYINKVVRQDLIVVDALTAMEGLGPIWGTPVKMNLLISGRNPAAVDAVCCKVMGINPYSVEVLWRAYKNGMADINIEKIEVVGESLDEVKRRFAYPTFLKRNLIGALRTVIKTYI